MLKSGDRIVMTRPSDPELSGIVVMADDAGYGDWAIVVWDGAADGIANYDFGVLNEFVFEVVESGCSFAPLPERVETILRQSLDKAKAELEPKSDAHMRELVALVRIAFATSGVDRVIKQMVDALRKGMPDKDLSHPESKNIVLSILKDNLRKAIGEKADVNFLQGASAYLREELDAALATD